MKKIIIILLISSGVLHAQDLVITGTNAYPGADPCFQTHAPLTIKNVSNNTLNVICSKNTISQPVGAENFFCWAGECYGASTLVSDVVKTLAPGEGSLQTDFGGYFDAYCDPGHGVIEYCFYDSTDNNIMSCFIVVYNGVFTEVIEEKNKMLVYPNPAKEYINIYNNKYNATVSLIDILGKEIKSINFQNALNHQLYVGDMHKGIYFVNLINDKNEVIEIQKIIIN